MAGPSSHASERPRGLLHSILGTLTALDRAEMAAYVAISLAAALAGGFAAVCLVPLIQPGRALPVVGVLLGSRDSVEIQAAKFAAATAVFALLRWLAAALGARLVSRYGMRLRQQVHAKLIEASLTSLANSTSAEMANVLTYNVEIVGQGFNALLQLLVAGVTCAVSLALALWVSPPLVLATPLLAGIGLMAVRMFGREQSEVSRRYIADLTSLFWHSEDFPRRLRHVRSFQREDAEKASYADVSARLRDGYQRQLELIASGRLLLELTAALGIAAIFVIAHRWPGVDQASLIAACLLLGRLLPYLVSTRQSLQQLRSAGPALELWQRYMDLASARSSSPATHLLASRDGLHIQRLRVSPPSKGLELSNLWLLPGEMTVVSGNSGIGKSSLVDVMAGMTPPQEFTARVHGRSIGFGEYRELVSHGAYVSQSVRPWQRSVRECLLWAATDVGDDVLWCALADVGLETLLVQSERGLDTALFDSSSKLSGGELQRLMLAQVILRQPYLALLDEATSALDAAAEMQVLSTLRHRLPQTIMIVVSHRHGVATIADQQLLIGPDLRTCVTRLPQSDNAIPKFRIREG